MCFSCTGNSFVHSSKILFIYVWQRRCCDFDTATLIHIISCYAGTISSNKNCFDRLILHFNSTKHTLPRRISEIGTEIRKTVTELVTLEGAVTPHVIYKEIVAQTQKRYTLEYLPMIKNKNKYLRKLHFLCHRLDNKITDILSMELLFGSKKRFHLYAISTSQKIQASCIKCFAGELLPRKRWKCIVGFKNEIRELKRNTTK